MSFPSLPDYPSLDLAAASYAVKVVHFVYPPLLLTYFSGAVCATFWLKQNTNEAAQRARRDGILCITLAILISYVLESATLLVHSLAENGWWASEDAVVYAISSVLVWGVLQLSLLESLEPVWYPYWGSWVGGLIAETVISALSWNADREQNIFDMVQICIRYLRVALLLSLPILFWGFRKRPIELKPSDSQETAPLLGQQGSNAGYGAVIDIGGSEEEQENLKEREFKERVRKRREESGWWEYARSFKIFWPHIWPQKDRALQLNMALVGACLLFERGLNILVPLQVGRVTNALMTGGLGHIPWAEVSIFILLRFLDSGAGVPALQRYLWMPVDQYAYRSITTTAYNHVLSLSSDFHSNKNTGELYSAVSQGRAVNGFIDMVLFSVLPMLGDLTVAICYFYFVFGIYMALVVVFVSVIYVWVTKKLTRMRTRMRRVYNHTARIETQMMWQTMSSWETVAYFNRVSYEQDRYSGAIKTYQVAERDYINGMSLLSATQNVVFTVGLLCASYIAVYQVTMGRRKVGDFVSLLSYWAQLAGPLSFFTSLFRKVQDIMLDAERLLELLQTKPSVMTKPGAKDLTIVNGDVTFQDVVFSYEGGKGAIQNMNFIAPGGKITALVGETGGGKSTCLKLLFRFYDVSEGGVIIDGQDIRDVTLESLRDQIGVVPQEPKLFNESIIDNLRYARFEASDEEIYAACRGAAIHDKILTFPDGYLSKVGEGGIKLSGGERQRIAIARAILKNPKIVLLDEATSSVDITTERLIQQALLMLAAGRTMFVIAHRLSTIMNADQILVISDGKIIERGKHHELLRLKGKYCELWSGELNNQIKSVDDGTLIEGIESGMGTSDGDIIKTTTEIIGQAEPDKANEGMGHTTPLNIKFAPLVLRRAEACRPHTYPRVPLSNSAPNPVFLEQAEKENVSPGKFTKHDSVLKPEAKEFIPTRLPIPTMYSSNQGIANPASGSSTETQVIPHRPLEESREHRYSGHDVSHDNQEVTGDEAVEQKHRRRRHRRRSRSSRGSSGNDQPPPVIGSVTAQDIASDGYYPLTVCYPQSVEPEPKEVTGSELLITHCAQPTASEISADSIGLAHQYERQNTRSENESSTFTRTAKASLCETDSNVSGTKKSTINREGRGGQGQRWKPQGKFHNFSAVGNGYGAISSNGASSLKGFSTLKGQNNSIQAVDTPNANLDKTKVTSK